MISVAMSMQTSMSYASDCVCRELPFETRYKTVFRVEIGSSI